MTNIVLPIKQKDVYGGLAEITGLIRRDSDTLVLEYQVKDDVLGMFNSDVKLSPRWSIGASSGFDLKNKGFTFTQLRFARDLKSWRMTFNWTPFGRRESWFFFIGIKSNIFSDIKYDKNREPLRRLN
jgi:hypothetical protein